MPSKWIGNVRPTGVVPVPVLVCGHRDFSDYRKLVRYLDKICFWFNDVIACSPGTEGVAKETERWAYLHWYELRVYHTDWSWKRTKRMVKEVAGMHKRATFVAVHDGDCDDTLRTIKLARRYFKPHRIHVKRV